MRRQNLAGVAEPPALGVAGVKERSSGSAVVLDCRSAEAFGAGHVPAINVGLGASFPTGPAPRCPKARR